MEALNPMELRIVILIGSIAVAIIMLIIFVEIALYKERKRRKDLICGHARWQNESEDPDNPDALFIEMDKFYTKNKFLDSSTFHFLSREQGFDEHWDWYLREKNDRQQYKILTRPSFLDEEEE